MAKILLTYGTTEGHTAAIAQRVADALRLRGHAVDVRDARHVPSSALAAYEAVIVGASVHMSKHDRQVVNLVRENRALLDRVPSAFFSVSLAAHGDLAEAHGYVDGFELETGWRPARLALFSGALTYTRYGFLKRRLMRRIARAKPGDLGLDTTRDYVYTDWADVDRFAEDFATDLAARAG